LFTYGSVFNNIQVPPPQAPAHLTTIEPPPLPLDLVVQVTARKNDVDPRVVKSIIKAESGFQSDAVSPAGALGYMQLMPETAADLGYDPMVPEQNIQAGTEYLGWLIDRYRNHRNGLQLAIAAYNAGPGNVERYRGIPPFRETRNYVKRVLAYYGEYRRVDRPAPSSEPTDARLQTD
jgi:soluble lytic murein transglycosylase-like protein